MNATVSGRPGRTQTRGYDWPQSLLELPRQMGVKTMDFGLSTAAYNGLCARAGKGDEEARKELDKVLQTLLECMARDTESRLVLSDVAEVPVIKGEAQYQYETVSKWAIRHGADEHIGGEGSGRVRPRAGHWHNLVEELFFADLAPRLKFADDTEAVAAGPVDPDVWKNHHKEFVSNEGPVRKQLMSWAKDYVGGKKKSSWNGQ